MIKIVSAIASLLVLVTPPAPAAAQAVDAETWIAPADQLGPNWIQYGDVGPANPDTGEGVGMWFFNSLDFDRPRQVYVSVIPKDNVSLADAAVMFTRAYLEDTRGFTPEPVTGAGDGRAYRAHGRRGEFDAAYLVYREDTASIMVAVYARPPKADAAEQSLLAELDHDAVFVAGVQSAFIRSTRAAAQPS